VLALLNAEPAWHALIALAPSGLVADRILARLIADDPDPGLRLEAIELMGWARFLGARGTKPVDRGREGELFVVGPAEAPTAVMRVEDLVVGPDGSRRVHWIPVPPHVATAREAVAWSFRTSAGAYAPEVET
jgi:hypothetical protein